MRVCQDCTHYENATGYDPRDDETYYLMKCKRTGYVTDDLEPCDEWEGDPERMEERISELRRELDSYDQTHMRLPLDADGVPIRIGDMLTENGDPCKFEVMSLTYYEDCVDVNACGSNPKLCHHVKPRTIEDVLGDAVGELFNANISTGSTEWDEVIAKYADELREMGGDA